MEFALPEHVSMAVAKYDPVLKARLMAERRARQPKSKKTSSPLGQPVGLFPAEMMPAEIEASMVADVNSKSAADRWSFMEIPSKRAQCILLHHENLWMAVWATSDKDADYLYGFNCAWKAAPSTADKVENIYVSQEIGRRLEMKDNATEVTFGRTPFYVWGKVITEQSILEGNDRLPWHGWLDTWGKYSADKNRQLERAIVETIKSRVPMWSDSHNVFERLKLQNNPSGIAFDRYGQTCGEWTEDNVRNRLDLPNKILDTPFFRREIARVMETVRSLAVDPKVETKAQVVLEWKYLKEQCSFANCFLEFYPEASLDYVQQMFEIGRIVDKPWLRSVNLQSWVRKNVPIASWVNLFATFRDEVIAGESYAKNIASRPYCVHTYHFSYLNDTLNMIATVLNANNNDIEKVSRPDRWRITEFHDHFVKEAFKVNNADGPLPQALFPSPVKIQHLGSTWTFLQPNSVHQLAHWGAAVRNCVGSASSYREGIKKHTHVIILAMVDSKPRFTIQAKVRNANLDIQQIAGIGNSRLTEEERSAYELTFAAAIAKQNAILEEANSKQ